jgi:uncharacterized protein
MKNVALFPVKPASEEAPPATYTAFQGHRCVSSGALADVARGIKSLVDPEGGEPILVFDDLTGEVIEIDLRGTADEVLRRLAQAEETITRVGDGPQKRGPGRPRLGVIAREVTLLPGQWDWLEGQPGGASAALRRLVYEAKRTGHGKERARRSQDAVYRFMTTMAGDFPNFEEALRAFYRREHQRFDSLVEAWPKDVRSHLEKLVADSSMVH